MELYKQMSLFGSSELEKKTENTEAIDYPSRQRISNNSKNYGLSIDNLSCFKSKSPKNYETLKRIYTGINNIDIPHEMWQQLNTSSGLALYKGAAFFKRYGVLQSEGKKYDKESAFLLSFEAIVSGLVSYGSDNKGISIMRKRGFNKHQTHKGELKKRMSKLSRDAKDKFIQSLKTGYIQPGRQNHDGFFYDPNCDGSDDYLGRSIYIRHIFDKIKSIYQKNTNSRNID